jgi:hypothetical protein
MLDAIEDMVAVDSEVLRNPNISLEAKGLYAMLCAGNEILSPEDVFAYENLLKELSNIGAIEFEQ